MDSSDGKYKFTNSIKKIKKGLTWGRYLRTRRIKSKVKRNIRKYSRNLSIY